jgi:hypothetical protein
MYNGFEDKKNFPLTNLNKYVQDKGKGYPRTAHEVTDGGGGVEVYLYSFFNLDARWGWFVNATPRQLYPRERPGTGCIGGWVGPRAGLDRWGKSRLRPG